ncbi:hypothetical protein VTO58DRAFT_106092 [Aureobasidium pullulans]
MLAHRLILIKATLEVQSRLLQGALLPSQRCRDPYDRTTTEQCRSRAPAFIVYLGMRHKAVALGTNEFRRTEAAWIEGQNKVLARVRSTCYYDQSSQGSAQLAPEQVRAAEQAAGEQEEEDDDDDDEEILDFSQYPTKVKHLLVEKWKHLSLYALLHKHDAATEMIMDIFDTIVDQVSNDESSYGTKANA